MPTRLHPKRAIYLEGLFFEPGRPFSTPIVAGRVYGLLLGANHGAPGRNIHELRSRATTILLAIFSVCLGRVETFFFLQNSNLGWQIVAGDLAENHGCSLTSPEVEELVRVFANARGQFLTHARDGMANNSGTSELTELIDRWLDATRQADPTRPTASSQNSQQSLELVSRPAPLENILARFHLGGHGSSSLAPDSGTPSTAQVWPPTHLAQSDAQLLAYPKIRDRLTGVAWRTKGPMPSLPTEKMDPLGLRLFVSWLGVAHDSPGCSSAVYMAPIAFLVNKERQDWYQASGYQSKMFGHMAGFLEYAAEAFKGGKSMVSGLLTPFFATVDETRALAISTGRPILEVFNNHGNLHHFGTGIVMRLVERNGVAGIQVALFCPWDKHTWIKNDWKQHEWRLLVWKNKIIAAVETWATEQKVVIHEGYSGGSLAVRKDRDSDSVEMSAGWLLRVVTATEKTIPGTSEEEAWEWEELCLFKKVQNWCRCED